MARLHIDVKSDDSRNEIQVEAAGSTQQLLCMLARAVEETTARLFMALPDRDVAFIRVVAAGFLNAALDNAMDAARKEAKESRQAGGNP